MPPRRSRSCSFGVRIASANKARGGAGGLRRRRQERAVDPSRLEVSGHAPSPRVVADTPDETDVGAECACRRSLVRALSAERLGERSVGDGLSRRRQARALPHQVDVGRSDDHDPGAHPVDGTRRRARIGENGEVVTPLDRIRCLSIIAHIDHGKSTLADRLLEMTGAVDPRDMRAQYLDTMDLERERGITIKAQNERLEWNGYVVNLIDTPGHVDFGYEVSRSLAACEGVILLVDSSQGIEAQTLANCYQAMEHDLTVVAALNKIDLPAADPQRYAAEIETVLGIPAGDILHISAKTGEGVPALLDAVIEHIPAPG